MNARSLLAVALAALLAPLAAPAQTRGGRATTRTAAAPAANALSIGGWIGPELGDADGFQLRADGELPFRRLTTGATMPIDLSLVGSIGYTFADVGGVDVNRLKIVPTARFTMPLNPQFSVFGDAGLGLHYTSVDYGSAFVDDDSEVSLLLRLGAGAFFQIAPTVRLGAQLVLDPMFGDYDDTTFSILGGAMFTL